jgi:hypothetical protein
MSQNQKTQNQKTTDKTAMKMYINFLALCVFHPAVWVTTAFAPKGLTSTIQPKVTSTSLKNSNVSDMYASSISSSTSTSRPLSSDKAISTPFISEKSQTANLQIAKGDKKDVWETASPIIVQGGSLRTWSETTGAVQRVQVEMKTEGRPLNANVELWHGPDNTPLKMSIYCEDGGLRPFSAVIETPNGQNTVAIRNTGQMEFPLAAIMVPDVEDSAGRLLQAGDLKTLQGGAMNTYPFDHSVASVQVLLKTGGRPLNARIELLQGPNNDKQCIDIYTEDGLERQFYAVIETPGTGNVVRIINTATVEFPLTASVQAYEVDAADNESGANGWDNGGTGSFLPRGKW